MSRVGEAAANALSVMMETKGGNDTLAKEVASEITSRVIYGKYGEALMLSIALQGMLEAMIEEKSNTEESE